MSVRGSNLDSVTEIRKKGIFYGSFYLYFLIKFVSALLIMRMLKCVRERIC